MKRIAILNAAMGGWYPQGQERLLNSLQEVGYTGDILHWTDNTINDYYQSDCVYTIKAAALWSAYVQKYDVILWLDCAIYAVKHPQYIISLIQQQGGYFIPSGFSLGQTANDYALHYAGISRDRACELPELNTCVFGIDLTHEQGKRWFDYFMACARDRVFHGSRQHDNQSKDPRFLFHRQDQTAGTLAYYRAGFDCAVPFGKHVEFAVHFDEQKQKDVIFLSQGL